MLKQDRSLFLHLLTAQRQAVQGGMAALSLGLSGDPGPISAVAPPSLGGVLSVWSRVAPHVSVFQPAGKGVKVYAKAYTLEVVQVTFAHIPLART